MLPAYVEGQEVKVTRVDNPLLERRMLGRTGRVLRTAEGTGMPGPLKWYEVHLEGEPLPVLFYHAELQPIA